MTTVTQAKFVDLDLEALAASPPGRVVVFLSGDGLWTRARAG